MKMSTAMATVGAFATAALAGGAGATTLDVTVTNTAAAGGFSLTPFLSAFHDGSFDPVTQGEAASPGLETLAETGVPGELNNERAAQVPSSTATVVASGTPPVPAIQPGETASSRVDVDSADQRFFSYFSMIVPSYDTFVGTEDPTANAIFGADGSYLGDQTFTISGADILEANTEINDRSVSNPAFLPATGIGTEPPGSTDSEEGGTIGDGEDLSEFAGETTLAGYNVDGGAIDFLADEDAFNVARIDVARVPVPGTGLMLVGALGLLGAGQRLRRRR